MLPLAGLDVGVGPRQAEDVGEQALGQAVATDHLLGQVPAVGGEVDGRAVERHEALGLHPLDHLGHRRPGDVQPLGDACLDDVDVVFLQLPDRLAILLESGVKLGSGTRAQRQPTAGRTHPDLGLDPRRATGAASSGPMFETARGRGGRADRHPAPSWPVPHATPCLRWTNTVGGKFDDDLTTRRQTISSVAGAAGMVGADVSAPADPADHETVAGRVDSEDPALAEQHLAAVSRAIHTEHVLILHPGGGSDEWQRRTCSKGFCQTHRHVTRSTPRRPVP